MLCMVILIILIVEIDYYYKRVLACKGPEIHCTHLTSRVTALSDVVLGAYSISLPGMYCITLLPLPQVIMDNTSEYEIFQKNIFDISMGISADLAEFATKAMARNLISLDKLKETLDSPKTAETATKLLLDFLPKIKQDISKFYKIREILQSMPTCETVVKMLQLQSTQVRKLQPTYSYNYI